MKLYRITFIAITVLLLAVPFSGQSQCRSWAEKCKIDWGDFRFNGQYNGALLVPEESAELTMIFYNKHDYRISICPEEHLGDVEFEILSSEGKVLFSNKDYEMTQYWDFSMSSTQRLTIRVTAPSMSEDMAMEGCVSLHVGYRPTPKKGFH